MRTRLRASVLGTAGMDPEPDPVASAMLKFEETLPLEPKFRSYLDLPHVPKEKHDVTVGMRDGSAHVLRCLKIWYDLPTDVFFIATNLMDRFITQMKVKSKHMACVAIASFQLACQIVCQSSAPELQDILAISQAKCSVADLVRMQTVISSKLGATPSSPSPVTSITFLRLFHTLCVALDEDSYTRMVNEHELTRLLEVVLCDTRCSNFRPSDVALAVLCSAYDSAVSRNRHAFAPGEIVPSLVFVVGRVIKSHETNSTFLECHSAVLKVVKRYNAEHQVQYRQRLVWKVSQRTLRHLRPTRSLVTTLQTIHENGQLQIIPPSINSSSSSS